MRPRAAPLIFLLLFLTLSSGESSEQNAWIEGYGSDHTKSRLLLQLGAWSQGFPRGCSSATSTGVCIQVRLEASLPVEVQWVVAPAGISDGPDDALADLSMCCVGRVAGGVKTTSQLLFPPPPPATQWRGGRRLLQLQQSSSGTGVQELELEVAGLLPNSAYVAWFSPKAADGTAWPIRSLSFHTPLAPSPPPPPPSP
mmetsp:Transcript_32352/g.91698  ORF Transcript_32352/g.91698 Transcript_32352/m.91698 type:complete len:198 (-) Transcript_32352:177-770(-)